MPDMRTQLLSGAEWPSLIASQYNYLFNFMKTCSVIYDSAVGLMRITATDAGLFGIDFDPEPDENTSGSNHPVIIDTINQLKEYFQGKRKVFNLIFDLAGTPFQKKVWDTVSHVGYGQVRTYQDIAKNVCNPKGVRAVGLANGKNPIPIIIPCHRIIGSNGKLMGYGGGLWRKEWLLRHEGAILL